MTKIMQQAIEKLCGLPDDKQESFARCLIHELETDGDWEATTSAHEDRAAKLVEDVLSADYRGETEVLD